MLTDTPSKPPLLPPVAPPPAFPPSQSPDPRLTVLEGPVFRALVLRPDGSTDLQAFAALWPHLRVMARCTPADKFTLVQVSRGSCLDSIQLHRGSLLDAA